MKTNTQRVKKLTEGSPAKLMVVFALPLMLGNVFQQLYTVTDTAIVGQFIGIEALAAIGASDWLNWMAVGMMQGVTQGFSISMSQNFGAGDNKKLSKVVGASITLCAVISLFLLLVGQLVAQPAHNILGTPETIMESAMLYLRIMYAGIPIVMCYNLLAAILRSLGDSRTPLYAMIIAAFLNIGLDLLFVVVFEFGIAGAAVATLMAQLFASVYCFIAIRKITIIKLKKSYLKPSKNMIVSLLKLGSPISLQNGIIAIGGMVVQSVINRYEMLFIAGYTATMKLFGLLEIASSSYGYAVTSYVGQNLGAGKIDRIKKGMRSVAVIAVATSAIIAACMIIFGRNILSLFITGTPEQVAQAMDIAYTYLFIMSVFLPILYLLYIYRSALMGLGNTITPMISGISELALRISVVLIAPPIIGVMGIYFAEVSAWVAATIVLSSVYFMSIRKICKKAK